MIRFLSFEDNEDLNNLFEGHTTFQHYQCPAEFINRVREVNVDLQLKAPQNWLGRFEQEKLQAALRFQNLPEVESFFLGMFIAKLELMPAIEIRKQILEVGVKLLFEDLNYKIAYSLIPENDPLNYYSQIYSEVFNGWKKETLEIVATGNCFPFKPRAFFEPNTPEDIRSYFIPIPYPTNQIITKWTKE